MDNIIDLNSSGNYHSIYLKEFEEMEITIYINEKIDLQNIILQFLESEQCDDLDFQKIIEKIEIIYRDDGYCEFMQIIQLIYNILDNHHRNSSFLEKIFMISNYIAKLMKRTLSNLEIFNIFKNNILILLSLFESKSIIFDYNIYIEIIQIIKIDKSYSDYNNYFYPEIKKLFENESICKFDFPNIQYEFKMTETLNQNRFIGENDSYICSLIRLDSVEEFVAYINRKQISPSSTIKPSFYETNQFLIGKEPSLIEYSAFFGSIQIFTYLYFCNVKLNPSIWLYVIHSQNAELIHFLESNDIEPPNNSYETCFLEAIKCHHNAIAEYIFEVLMEKSKFQSKKKYETALCYHNFCFFPSDFIYLQKSFLFLCSNNYNKIVDIFLNAKENEMKEIILLYSFV